MDMLQKKIFLAMTAHDMFWDKAHPIVFLGGWCKKIFDQEEIATETIIHSYSEEQKNQIYNYVRTIHESILITLTSWLNKIHSTSYSLKYWRIVIGPFLLSYIFSVYNKYDQLNRAYELHPNLVTTGLAATSYITPTDTAEFFNFSADSDLWNLQLYTQILLSTSRPPELLKNFFAEEEYKARYSKSCVGSQYVGLRTKLKRKLIHFYVKKFSRRLILHTPRMAYRSSLLFLLSAGKLVTLQRLNVPTNSFFKNISVQLSLREEIANLPAKDEFSKIILETLKVNMPVCFVEGYKENVNLAYQAFPYHPSCITTTVEIVCDDLFKFWAAKQAEGGTKIIGIQHGGSYWTQKKDLYHILEHDVVDYFLSWGWGKNSKIIPTISPPISCELESYLKRRDSKNIKSTLWVSGICPRHPREIPGYITSQQYFGWQKRFYEKLDDTTTSNLILRLYPANFPGNYKYYLENFGKLQIQWTVAHNNFINQLYTTKIFISDNLNTTFYYALAFNIPTILFFDIDAWGASEESLDDFDVLSKVGIFHHTPESAATFLNVIEENPFEWWNKNEVQSVRQAFCDKVAKTSNNWSIDFLKSLLYACKKDNAHCD